MLCDGGWVGALHNVQKRLWEVSKDPHCILQHTQFQLTQPCVLITYDAKDSRHLWNAPDVFTDLA